MSLKILRGSVLSMSPFRTAVQFALESTFRDDARPGEIIRIAGHGPGKLELPAMIFPPDRAQGEPETILVVHGMAFRGHQDPRMINYCRILSGLGFQVVAPHYEEIARLEITRKSIDRIAATIQAVTRDPSLCPRGRLSFFSGSFSGGMCLAAAARSSNREKVNALLIAGSPARFDTTLRYLLGQEDIDEYGAMIIFKNYSRIYPGGGPELARAFELAALDLSFKPPPARLPAYLESLPPKKRELFSRIRNDREFRLNCMDRILEKRKNLQSELSAVELIDGIRAAVVLLHGEDDIVVPPQESALLYERLREMNADALLEITPLLSHERRRISLRALFRIWPLIKAFRHFFERARPAPGRPGSSQSA